MVAALEKHLAIITARGGSKRIPRKNIKDFLGRPILQYSLEAAHESGLFDEVMVSTDDAEIAEIASKLGATVPFMRSRHNSDDFATTADVIQEVVEEYHQRNRHFDYLCCLYPTAPFVNAAKLKESLTLLKEKEADALVPVCRFSYPIQRAFKIEENRLVRMWPEHERSRSQDLPPAYHDVGQFYWHRVKSFLIRDVSKDQKIVPFLISELEMQDLDTLEDWELAELKYQQSQFTLACE